MRLLLVEDSDRLRATVAHALSRLGHAVDEAVDGREAEIAVSLNDYDAIVLDLMLPHRNGIDLLVEWRRQGNPTPILILTAKDAIDDRVRGLALGADDYLVKPFAIEELLARIGAIVRRRHGQLDAVLRVGDLTIDLSSRSVKRAGEEIVLTAREFALLECLARRPGHTLTREQIESHLYGEEASPLSNAVDAAVYSLRRKLSPGGAPPLIHTRRGLGYVFQEKR